MLMFLLLLLLLPRDDADVDDADFNVVLWLRLLLLLLLLLMMMTMVMGTIFNIGNETDASFFLELYAFFVLPHCNSVRCTVLHVVLWSLLLLFLQHRDFTIYLIVSFPSV